MKKENVSLLLNFVLIVAVAVLFVLHFKGNKGSGGFSTKDLKVNSNIIYLNTDSVWNDYKFVKDKKKDLKDYEDKLQEQYNVKAESFKERYDAYLKEGTSGKLSLSEQKKREEQLGMEQRELQEYDKNLSDQLINLKEKVNNEIQDSITNYLKKHYSKDNITYIMAYSRISGILYANDKLDITKDVINNLNKIYEARKGKRH